MVQLIFDRNRVVQSINLRETDQKEMSNIRGNEIGMIFQEPMTALNPVLTVERQLTEGLRFHKKLSKSESQRKSSGDFKASPSCQSLRKDSSSIHMSFPEGCGKGWLLRWQWHVSHDY